MFFCFTLTKLFRCAIIVYWCNTVNSALFKEDVMNLSKCYFLMFVVLLAFVADEMLWPRPSPAERIVQAEKESELYPNFKELQIPWRMLEKSYRATSDPVAIDDVFGVMKINIFDAEGSGGVFGAIVALSQGIKKGDWVQIKELNVFDTMNNFYRTARFAAKVTPEAMPSATK